MVVFYADACCLAFGVAFRIFGGYLIKTPINTSIDGLKRQNDSFFGLTPVKTETN